MACDRCVPAMSDALVIGAPLECQCDYCGARFIAGKPNQCLECDYYWSEKTDEGRLYFCHNDDADRKSGNCSGFSKEEINYAETTQNN